MNEKTVNERLKCLINAKSKSENDFARLVGEKQATVNNYIRLNRMPSLAFTIKVLSTFPDISPDWLLLGTGPMYRTTQPNELNNFYDSTVNSVNTQGNAISGADPDIVNKLMQQVERQSKQIEKLTDMLLNKQ